MKVGFVGLGIMGRPMAKHLVKAGYDVLVSDLNPNVVAELVSDGAASASYEEIGKNCGIIMTILPTGGIVKEVLFGAGGIASFVQPGTVVIDHSSVTPNESRECYDALKKVGADFLDAPGCHCRKARDNGGRR